MALKCKLGVEEGVGALGSWEEMMIWEGRVLIALEGWVEGDHPLARQEEMSLACHFVPRLLPWVVMGVI